MNRRTFITRALAGAIGAVAILRGKPAEQKQLTVKEWAEQNRFKPGEIGPSIRMTPPTRIDPWPPLEAAVIHLPVGYVYLTSDDGKTWEQIGTTPGGTVKLK